jgi:hypothetical protein
MCISPNHNFIFVLGLDLYVKLIQVYQFGLKDSRADKGPCRLLFPPPLYDKINKDNRNNKTYFYTIQ